jgi:aminoglycoside phosphotransferase (APT) family kinase protein
VGDGINAGMNSKNSAQMEKPLAYGRQAEIFAWEEGQVIKLFSHNQPEDVQREFKIAQSAYRQGARTPQPLAVVEKNGRPGIVFEQVEGPSLLRLLGLRPWQAIFLARQFAELHHTVHRCKAPELPSARPELEKIIQSRQELSFPIKVKLLELLSKLQDGEALLHGDFHPDNVMVTSQGMVIIDWPNAARGCPLADVARTTIMLRIGEPVEKITVGLLLLSRFLRGVFRSAYVKKYMSQSPYSESDLKAWEIILAAQRIGDHIPGEEQKLIKFIEQNLTRIRIS